MKSRLMLLLIILLSSSKIAQGQRIKDITDVQGIRGNPITGIGLVYGLADTGDSTLPSQQILVNIFKDAGLVFSASDFSGGNVALVMVRAELGPFNRVGSQITATVSSIGDAENLQGGTLLPTLLKGLDGDGILDGQVYAIAEGPISISGWTASGDQASITKNHPLVGKVAAIVEKEEIATFVEYLSDKRFITLNLRNIDFSTAEQIGRTIDKYYPDSATVIDAGTIKVEVPKEIGQENIVGFIDDVTRYEVKVDAPAVVVINERTGTIVVGENVGISSVAIAQGSLTVKIKENEDVSQPTGMFNENATTEVTQSTDIAVAETEGILIAVPRTVTIADLANTLNAIGATPTDLIAMFHALKEAGALQAKLIIM